MRRPGFRPLLAAALVAGCALEVDHSGTDYRCPDGRCPPGLTCFEGVCAAPAPGVDAPADSDAAADAAVDAAAGPDAGVCELAAQAPPNDGCAAAIDLTAAALGVGGAVAYGSTAGYASDLTPAIIATCTGAPQNGPDAVYRLDLQAGDQLTASLAPLAWNASLYLLDACTASAECLAGSDAAGTGIEVLDGVSIATAGRHYLVVDAQTESGCFVLEARVTR